MVEFVVRVPEIPSLERTVYLAGDGPASANGAPTTSRSNDAKTAHTTGWSYPAAFAGDSWSHSAAGVTPRTTAAAAESCRELHVDHRNAIEVNITGWGARERSLSPRLAPSRLLPHPRTISV